MKNRLPWILVIVLAVALIGVIARGNHGTTATPQKSAAVKSEKKILYWIDPMHPAYKSDKPGIAPDCGMDLVPVYEGEENAAAGSSSAAGYASITIPPERQQLIGVKSGLVERRSIDRSFRTTGRVAADETRLAKVTTKFDGYIEKLYVDFTGKAVRRGQPLFTVYSPELLAAQQEYLLAVRAAKQVPQSGNALLESARQRLLLWDVTPAELRQLELTGVARKNVTVYSPVSGIVTNKMAVAGGRVMAGEPLFDLADLSRVWILADVYESELGSVKVGSPAAVTLSYLPGRTFNGRVAFIAPSVDPMTRTVQVRIEVNNADAALKPEMFADVTFSTPQRDALVVPESAVLQTGARSVVFVIRNNTFEPRDVQVGQKSGDFYEVRSGLTEGEKVATDANFLIDSESRLKAALAQMSGPGGHSGHGQ